MRMSLLIAAMAVVPPFPAAAQGSNPDLGRNLAATCANCHNTTGRSVTNTPSITGMPAERMLSAMRDFRDGRRPATVMHQLAKGYTDAQLVLIAAHFAAQK